MLDRAKAISMLHQETLQLLYSFTEQAPGDVLEIGAYLGGGTVVMGLAAKASAKRVITIEPGGKHDNPHLPSDDIWADLRRNIAAWGVSDAITPIHGVSYREDTLGQVSKLFPNGRKIGLLVVDADGLVARDFALYRSLLAEHALLVIDDWEHVGGDLKSQHVRPFIEHGLAEGVLHDLGIHLWSTWAGQVR
jgi:predicted O-methyltransferase YrrM